jgi:NADH-quinone oxidoreductase subunit N
VLRIDDLALILDLVFAIAGLAAVALSARETAAPQAGHGEYHSLLLFSVLGMAVLVSAENLVTLFIGFELLSIPLYILCASDARRAASLESGLKYLVIGSVGSATLVYGLALIYGATGSTDFDEIANAITGSSAQAGGLLSDPLLLTGIALTIVGFAFKASVAPFHQWTPDVYEGAPTPITAFMATATKAAAIGVFLRFFDVAVIGVQTTWAPLLAALATITIIVGNVGALGQSSVKRILAYSGVAQAGYMLAGVVVGTQLGIDATVFYILTYLPVNIAAFAVIVARQRQRAGGGGEDISALAGLGARQPWLAWPMTIAMLSLAGIPGTVGFIGKLYLIRAMVADSYTWLAVVIVVGSMISLGYYLRVIATMWMSSPERGPAPARAAAGARPAIAGGSPEADAADAGGWPAADSAVANAEVAVVAVLFGAAGVLFGIIPSPLLRLVAHAGRSITGIF